MLLTSILLLIVVRNKTPSFKSGSCLNCGLQRLLLRAKFLCLVIQVFAYRLSDFKIVGCIIGYTIFYYFSALTCSWTSPGFYLSAVQVFKKHCRKRRNCLLQAIFPFPTVFSTRLKNFLPFSSNLKLSSAISLNFEESKICSTCLLKTLQERTNCLLRAISPFRSVFYPFG